MPKVFLGGTCNDSTWREELIKLLTIDYFNPVVDDWNEECYQEELRQREMCDFCLYVITPKMSGAYSVAEAVDDSNKRPMKTVFCIIVKDGDEEFNKFQMKSLNRVGQMIDANGGAYLKDLKAVADFLNDMGKLQ